MGFLFGFEWVWFMVDWWWLTVGEYEFYGLILGLFLFVILVVGGG